jgi:hypothetical protein
MAAAAAIAIVAIAVAAIAVAAIIIAAIAVAAIISIPTLAAICCSKGGKLVKSAALHCN